MTAVFSLTLGLGAYLVFSVEPQVGKWVLPLLGGTPGVWNTCIVFFQLALLAGYAYAHALGRLPLAAQGGVHALLMLAAAALLPLRISAEMAPSAEHPEAGLFLLLATRIGVPFFALAATAPLVQRWLACTRHPDARDPYFLYAASNVGSLLALLSYPTLVEPALDLRAQSQAWAGGYALLVAGMGAVFALTLRARDPLRAAPLAAPTALGLARRARWVALAAVPSSLMLSVTTHLTTDVAAVPLLWVLALALYLLTFILAFARRRLVSQRFMSGLLPIAVVLPLLSVSLQPGLPWWLLTLGHLLALFSAAMVCHGELAADRPPAARLTEFYLWVSLGGALGGLFNALVAPQIFGSVLEYPLGLIAACLLRPDLRERAGDRLSRDLMAASLAILVALLAALGLEKLGYASRYAVALPIAAALSQWPHARRHALLLAAAFCAAQIQEVRSAGVVAARRSFFGVVKVIALDGGFHGMMHGNTVHGLQSSAPGPASCVMSYYPPVREAFDVRGRADSTPFRVGALGLGIGTVLACGEPGEHWRFFEINPDVVALASDARYFRYLSGSAVAHDIVVGEGRLALAREPAQSFDVLILDAFSSDAIPVHLLTREAFAMYTDKLAPRGLMLVHISNRYLDLVPVVSAIAADLGLAARMRSFMPSAEQKAAGLSQAEWIALARDADGLGALASDARWQAVPASPLRPWTDGYSSLLRVVRWTRPPQARPEPAVPPS